MKRSHAFICLVAVCVLAIVWSISHKPEEHNLHQIGLVLNRTPLKNQSIHGGSGQHRLRKGDKTGREALNGYGGVERGLHDVKHGGPIERSIALPIKSIASRLSDREASYHLGERPPDQSPMPSPLAKNENSKVQQAHLASTTPAALGYAVTKSPAGLSPPLPLPSPSPSPCALGSDAASRPSCQLGQVALFWTMDGLPQADHSDVGGEKLVRRSLSSSLEGMGWTVQVVRDERMEKKRVSDCGKALVTPPGGEVRLLPGCPHAIFVDPYTARDGSRSGLRSDVLAYAKTGRVFVLDFFGVLAGTSNPAFRAVVADAGAPRVLTTFREPRSGKGVDAGFTPVGFSLPDEDWAIGALHAGARAGAEGKASASERTYVNNVARSTNLNGNGNLHDKAVAPEAEAGEGYRSTSNREHNFGCSVGAPISSSSSASALHVEPGISTEEHAGEAAWIRVCKELRSNSCGSYAVVWGKRWSYLKRQSIALKELAQWGTESSGISLRGAKEKGLSARRSKLCLLSTMAPGEQWQGGGASPLLVVGMLPLAAWRRLLRGADFLLGLGDPVAGPTAIEALAAGTTYVNPVFRDWAWQGHLGAGARQAGTASAESDSSHGTAMGVQIDAFHKIHRIAAQGGSPRDDLSGFGSQHPEAAAVGAAWGAGAPVCNVRLVGSGGRLSREGILHQEDLHFCARYAARRSEESVESVSVGETDLFRGLWWYTPDAMRARARAIVDLIGTKF